MKSAKNKKPASDNFTETSPARLALIEMIDQTPLEAQAMCYTCLKIAGLRQRNKAFLLDVLQEKLGKISNENVRAELDVKGDLLPAERWLSFLNGFILGIKG